MEEKQKKNCLGLVLGIFIRGVSIFLFLLFVAQVVTLPACRMATGVVTEVESSRQKNGSGGDSYITYHTQYTYTVDGHEVSGSSDVPFGLYRIGSRVTLVFPKTDPYSELLLGVLISRLLCLGFVSYVSWRFSKQFWVLHRREKKEGTV